MAKKRIFINIHYLEIGGAERALIGLLQALDYEQVEVDLFVNQHTGPLMEHIPPQVTLLPESRRWSQIEKPMVGVLLQGHADIVAARVLAKLRHKLYRKADPTPVGVEDASMFYYVASCVNPLMPRPAGNKQYDLAISFLTPHHQVANKVSALKKLAWIHTDYTRAVVNAKAELPVWSKFDHVVSISPDVTKTFCTVFPSLRERIVEIENIISPDFVRVQALADSAPELQGVEHIKLLSVGRPCYAKNYECIPPVVKALRQRGLDVHWYIVGGEASEGIQTLIDETETGSYVHFLGSRSNPYPYIAACDIYVQPSRYEGKSVTVREAQILCKPVVVTNYATAKSQVNDGVDGLIIPLTEQGITDGLESVIRNNVLRDRLVENLGKSDLGNKNQADKLLQLID